MPRTCRASQGSLDERSTAIVACRPRVGGLALECAAPPASARGTPGCPSVCEALSVPSKNLPRQRRIVRRAKGSSVRLAEERCEKLRRRWRRRSAKGATRGSMSRGSRRQLFEIQYLVVLAGIRSDGRLLLRSAGS
jgi:hypothetical protein